MVNRIILNETSYHGAGAIRSIVAELAARGLKKPIVFSDPDLIKFGVTKKVTDLLDKAKVKYAVYSEIKPNPTIQNVKNGVKAFKAAKADSIIAIGGGSSMDTAKAVGIIMANPKFADVRSLEGVAPTKNPSKPIFAVPTTAGTAAEVTINYVITDVEKKRKFVCVDPHDIPVVAFVDPDMMSSMPKGLTAFTGMDALTHAIEGLITKAACPMTDMMHLEAIRLISLSLRDAVANKPQGRAGMALGQYIAGMGFSNVGLGIDHSMAHGLSALYDMPHGKACAILLPTAMKFNAPKTGDKTSKICVMRKMPDGERRVIVETTCATTKEGFAEAFAKFERGWPVVFETGTHCRWMDKCFKRLGFGTIVANPGLVPSITKSNKKNDRNDARELARLAIADPAMLHPVFLRDEVYQQMLRFHHARNMLISQRTQTINQIRGFAKSLGHRIECASTEKFHEVSRADWPRELEEAVWPIMGTLKTINLKIRAYDKLIARLAEQPEFKAMVERVRVVYGVGIIGSTVFIAAIGGKPDRFGHSRDVGAYLGMTPRQDQSGDTDKQLNITHAGSDIVRTALVECAGVALMANAKDTDLKLKGLRIALRGGKTARKKARVAVARAMAVTMVALLQNPDREYVPLSEEGKRGFERYNAELEYLTIQKTAKKAA